MVVKANQPDLLWAIEALFADPPPGERFAAATTWGQHGDRVEVRRLRASPALAGYLDWPGARQVCAVERTTARRGTTTREVRFAVTSLGPEVAPAALLARLRGHWAIENRLHWVRGAAFGEDACRIRSGAAPRVLAALRNAVLGLLRLAGVANVAAALRHNARQPGAALGYPGLTP